MDSTLSSTQYDISKPFINLGENNKPFDFFMFIILIILFFIVTIPWNKIQFTRENMSGGTLTQLFAQDSQDVYLKGNVDKLATGNYNLFFNQPTRVANTFMNRGSPLPSFILPDTPMNPNPYAYQVSNGYTDNILNKQAKRPTMPNPIFALENILPDQVKNNKNNKNKVRPVLPAETQDYESVNGNKQQQTDYLAHTNTHTYSQSNDKKKLNNKKKLNSVPTIGDNILPSSLQMPVNPTRPANPYELSNVAKQIAVTKETADNLPAMTQWSPRDYLYQGYLDNLLYNKDCIKDPASCGGGAGGFRLGEDYVQATKAKPFVSLDGNTFYTDSYTGSYFIEPNFDIMRPIPYMPDSNLPPNIV